MIWLVGAGPMSVDYVKVLEAQEQDFIVLGRSESSAKLFEEKTGHEVVTGGIEQFLATKPEAPNAAIVSVGVEQLYFTTLSLLKFGVKSILVEKPGGVDAEQINALTELATSKKANVCIAYNRRFLASVSKAKELIEADGGVLSFNFEFTEWSHVIEKLDKDKLVLQNWLLGNSTHVIDMAFYLGGKPKELSSYRTNSLSWHESGAVFSGAGVTTEGALFNYNANWISAGRWSLEVLTKSGKYIFCPLETLSFQKRGEIAVSNITLDTELEKRFKPGLYNQVHAFINDDFDSLIAIKEHAENVKFYCDIAGYSLK